MAKTIEGFAGLMRREIDDLPHEDVKGLGEIVVGLFGVAQPVTAS